MIIKPLAAALLMSFSAGCKSSEASLALGGPDACSASMHQDLIGQDSAVLQTMKFSQPLRVVGPGEFVTMDFNPHRLNIDISDTDVVIAVRCG